MHRYASGNASLDGLNSKGWFIGHFIADDSLRRSNDVEVKWASHPKGESNGSFAANRTATTMSILISGKFNISFRDEGERDDVLLVNAGDYALWPPLLEHDWTAVEDSVVLTVRWPSIAKDQESRARSKRGF